MNFPAFQQLNRSIERSGWAAQRKTGDEFPMRVMSVLPSITEHFRCSLFSRKVQALQRSSEVVAFREHAALANVRSKGKPLLFTKSDLTGHGTPKQWLAEAGTFFGVIAASWARYNRPGIVGTVRRGPWRLSVTCESEIRRFSTGC